MIHVYEHALLPRHPHSSDYVKAGGFVAVRVCAAMWRYMLPISRDLMRHLKNGKQRYEARDWTPPMTASKYL